jgi:S1-C subfamily serine protease
MSASGERSLSILFLAMLSLTASAKEFSTSEIYQSAKAAVVKLTVLGQHNEPLKTGTGFFVSPDGVLVTNRHVVEDGYSIVAEAQNGAIYLCDGALSLPEDQDIAVLKFKASDQAFIKVSGTTTIEPGQKVVVIGAPLGLENTVSDGIVAALRQESDWIQITAPISPGSSGSPVFAEDGTLIGMATLSLVKGQQLNFAIPSRFVATAIEKARTTPLPLPINAIARTASTLAAEPEEVRRARENVSKSPLEAMRLANKHLQEDQSDFFAWRLRVVAADALGLQDEYLRSVQGAVRNLPEDMQTCSGLAYTLWSQSLSKSDRRVAPLLKQVAEKAISLGSDYSGAWAALEGAYKLLGDQEIAKEIHEKEQALSEQGELEYGGGVRLYQGALWVDPTRWEGAEVTERSGSIDLKKGPYSWTFPKADSEADTRIPAAVEKLDEELPKIEGRPWFFDRNCALRLKGNWYFSYKAARGPISALACAQTTFSNVNYQRVYVRAPQPDEVDHSPWVKRYDPSLAKSLEDLQQRSTGRVRILQSKRPLPEDGVLVVVTVYLAKNSLAGVSALIMISRYGSEEASYKDDLMIVGEPEPLNDSKSWSEPEKRGLRSYVYEEALRRSLDAVLPQRKDVVLMPALSTVGNKTHGTIPQVTLNIIYNEGSQCPISAEQLGKVLERSLDELRALVAGKTD